MLNKIYPLLKNQIYYLQRGFIKGRSCTTQMVYVLHHLGKVLDCSGPIDVSYLDFSKAFDSVPHNLLLYKLNQYCINGSLLNWFSSYLMGRRQRVEIESSFSDWLPVVSGVPQGSILGPFLFLPYINDLPSIVSPESTLALFADDSKCFRSIKALDHDSLEFQDDASAVKSWGDSWGMQFNSRCKILPITRSLHPHSYPYYMGDNFINPVNVYLDLGLMVASDLAWKVHVDSIAKKANRSLGLNQTHMWV